jgi:hypothetical protein
MNGIGFIQTQNLLVFEHFTSVSNLGLECHVIPAGRRAARRCLDFLYLHCTML